MGMLLSTTYIFQSISQFCSSNSTEISTSMDDLAIHTPGLPGPWAPLLGLMCFVNSSSLAGIDSGLISVVGMSWVSR